MVSEPSGVMMTSETPMGSSDAIQDAASEAGSSAASTMSLRTPASAVASGSTRTQVAATPASRNFQRMCRSRPSVAQATKRPSIGAGSRRGPRSSTSSGSRTKNTEPTPGLLSTPTVPDIAVTSPLAMDSPRPVPPNRRATVSSACA
jgi:hypothetical protein